MLLSAFLFSNYSAPLGVRSIVVNPSVCASVCVSTCLSGCPRVYLWNRWTDRHKLFVCGSPVAVACYSCGGVALCYVLSVLWMISRLAIVRHLALRGRPDGLQIGMSYVRDWGGD